MITIGKCFRVFMSKYFRHIKQPIIKTTFWSPNLAMSIYHNLGLEVLKYSNGDRTVVSF